MKKRIASIFAICLAALVFAGCYLDYNDNVITGASKVGNKVVYYFDFEGFFAAKGIDFDPETEEYAIGYMPLDGMSFAGGVSVAIKNSHGWGAEVPNEKQPMKIAFGIKRGGDYSRARVTYFESSFICSDDPEALCVVSADALK